MAHKFRYQDKYKKVITTDTTTTTILTFSLPNTDDLVKINYSVTANKTGSDQVYCIERKVLFANAAGTVTLRGTALDGMITGDAALSGLTVTHLISGTNVSIQVTGLSSSTIFWQIKATLEEN